MPPGLRTLIRNRTEASSREKWHQQIESFRDLSRYLAEGQPQPDPSWVEALRRSTSKVVNDTLAQEARDNVLHGMISKHAEKSPATRNIAVLSCLPILSAPRAAENLLALMDMPDQRYLRLLAVACQLTPTLIAEEEVGVIHSLLSILQSRQGAVESFRRLIEALVARPTATFITNDIVCNILVASRIRFRIESAVLELLDNRRFATLYDASSWLRIIDTARTRTEIELLLNEFFPSWVPLWLWRPNVERIRMWENGYLKVQRSKLWRIYDLDGPDTVGRRHERLAQFEPAVSQRLDRGLQNTATLERLLDDLHQAHRIGDAAVELFIHLFVELNPDADAIELLKACIATRNNSLCQELHSFLQHLDTSNSRSSLDRQIQSITKALQCLNCAISDQSQDVLARYIALNSIDMLRRAQDRFCEQMDRGLSGEYVGMCIQELGSAIYQGTWMHEHIPAQMRSHLSQLPSSDILEAIFQHAQDMNRPETLRFKAYLMSRIGGRELGDRGNVTMDDIKQELQFWRRSPGAARRDLARALVRIPSLEYVWYAKCLVGMLGERDSYIDEMRHMFQLGGLHTIREFTKYLTLRRSLNQLQNECWLELLSSIIREAGDQWLKRVAETMEFEQWKGYIVDLKIIIQTARSQLPGFSASLTEDQLRWWDRIAQKQAVVEFIVQHQLGRRCFIWIYFPARQSDVDTLLNSLSGNAGMTPLFQHIASRLHSDGTNVDLVAACFSSAERATGFGRRLCELMLARLADGWPCEGVATLMDAWQNCTSILAQDMALCVNAGELFFGISKRLTPQTVRPTADRLLAAYEALMEQARQLELLRVRLRRQEPDRAARLLDRIGVDNSGAGREFSADITEDLIDAVETVGDDEYEISFPLTKLNNLQRMSKGIPTGARMLLVRLRMRTAERPGALQPSFCIHTSPGAKTSRHRHWKVATPSEPSGQICKATPTIFTFYVARKLHRALRNVSPRDPSVLEKVYSTVQSIITNAPQTCLWCHRDMPVKLWKPVACTQMCSRNLISAPLEVRLHNILVDPLAIDLLLTSIYAAAGETAPLDLLPGCPVPRGRLRAVIDSLPPLHTLTRTNNLSVTIRDYAVDTYGVDRERLLSWLCLKFRGFLITAPDGFRVPSMPQTKQFVLVNSHPEREAQYQAQIGAQINSSVVFHGTRASRLFAILDSGLQPMTGRAMLHGASYGTGIYCGDTQDASLHFAGSTGQSWHHSELSNMRVMLGCELAAYAPSPNGFHVVADENRILVRYVFLLPSSYRCPIRSHVEPAMQAGCAMLRLN
jgi:hypothetical protein